MPWRRTVSFRLTMAFIAVVVVTNAALSLVTMLHIQRVLLAEVQTRVRLDLNSALRIYHDEFDVLERTLATVVADPENATPEDERLDQQLTGHLDAVHALGAVDILDLLDDRGVVLHRASNPAVRGDRLEVGPLLAQAARQGKPARGTLRLSGASLALEGAALAERARITVVPTPAARPAVETESRDGMLQAVIVPLLGGDGRVRRLLFAAQLLNRRDQLVDTIKDDVFQNQEHGGKTIGTATIFQDDLRIATNVRDGRGERAIGTRMSQTVYQQVIEQGNLWADRAFVVNDWYITAYAPLRDPAERPVGSLYVGLLEAPFAQTLRFSLGVFLGAMAVTTLGTLALLWMVTRLTLRPIGRILRMTRQVVAGDLRARINLNLTGEMGQLCMAVDQMAEAVAAREAQLERKTQEQIGQSEKLAAIGRLAAGVAHEINNPLTGVMTFAHLMRDKANMDGQDREDLQLIIRETTRVREIVRALLDFARESPSRMRRLELPEVLQHLMTLLRSQKAFNNIQIELRVEEPLAAVLGDPNQLQQVFINLALNACEAMPEGGHLRIDARPGKDGEIVVSFRDTGCGIPPENLQAIFDPFFTTKPVGKGTGLGLSVSYGIIQQHHGRLEVESEVGAGSCFRVSLPILPEGDQGGASEPGGPGQGRG